MGALESKVAVITGWNSGIGLATARRFVKEGAYVFITGPDQGAKTVSSLPTQWLAELARLTSVLALR
jgi:NAD(P)-dependent dehydrogenase (short-subunit alcohol dehydrogenase family)